MGLLLGTGDVSQSDKPTLTGMTDLHYANCVNMHCSVSGYCFLLGSGAVSWSSRKQPIVTTSTCEMEYVAACNTTKEAVWLHQILHKLGHKQDTATLICDNNQGAIVLTEYQSYHAKSKHINVQFHYVHKHTQACNIQFKYIWSCDNTANMFTKALHCPTFAQLRQNLGVTVPSKELNASKTHHGDVEK